MARPRSIDEARVLRAARDVFVARGAEATTREVAEAAGVSQALLFQRYGSKKRLFFAAMLPKPPSLDELIGDAPSPGPTHARAHLAALAGRLLTWIDGSMPGSLRAALHPDFPAAIDDAHAPAGADPILAAMAQRIGLLKGREDLGRELDPERVAATLTELLHGQALAALLVGGQGSVAGRAERAVSILWSGLQPGGERR